MAKAGRRRKSGRRQPNGQLARPAAKARERDARRTAIEARTRVHGVDRAVAHDQKAGYVLGRLALAGHITDALHDAGIVWIEIVHAFSLANEIPMRTPKAVDLNAVRGKVLSGGLSAATRARIRARYDEGFATLLEAGRDALHAVNACCLQDEIVLLHPLRAGLAALIAAFRLEANHVR